MTTVLHQLSLHVEKLDYIRCVVVNMLVNKGLRILDNQQNII